MKNGKKDRRGGAGCEVISVSVDRIREGKKFKFRMVHRDIESLKDDLRKKGQLTPLFVRSIDQRFYELVSGYRRLEALKKIGAPRAHVRVFPGLTDEEATKIAIAENIQRNDLLPLEKAYLCLRLQQQGKTRKEIAAWVFPNLNGGESDRTVQNYLTVARSDELVQKALLGDKIPFSVALLLAEKLKGRRSEDVFTPPVSLAKIIDCMAREQFSVRQAEKYLDSLRENPKKNRFRRRPRNFLPVRWKEEKRGWRLEICFTRTDDKISIMDLQKIEREIEKALERVRTCRTEIERRTAESAEEEIRTNQAPSHRYL